MSESIALQYHLNLNHRDLQPDQRDEYLDTSLPEMLSSLAVPTNISVCAEDLLVIRQNAPAAWNTLATNELITVLPSLYSHSLAELFPESFVEQAEAGQAITESLLPASKLSPFHSAPEISVPPKDTVDAMQRIWKGVLYCDQRAVQANGAPLPAYCMSPKGLAYAAAPRNSKYRYAYFDFMQEQVTADEVVAALRADKAESPNLPLVARNDLETPILHAVYFGADTTIPRVDLFAKLQEKFKASGFHFIHLDNEILALAGQTNIDATPVPSPGAVDRWQNPSLQATVASFSPRTGYQRLLAYSAQASDYFIHPGADRLEPATYEGRAGNIRIRHDGESRRHEHALKLTALASQLALGNVLKPGQDNYLHMVDAAIVQAAEILSA